MESYGSPRKITHMVQMLYECAVLDEGEESEWFKVKTGVKQRYVMSNVSKQGGGGDDIDNRIHKAKANMEFKYIQIEI